MEHKEASVGGLWGTGQVSILWLCDEAMDFPSSELDELMGLRERSCKGRMRS